ncbi:MAG: magnesium transporter CorA family protein [Gammaproteobacteria bacterium]|nr:magnesium transporter CorA family protein [Gammaproteobacteria bacterium]MBA3731008.1 magnesium transporter CorA family protein [Gammaproteobacteria bacterium]
MLFVYTAVDGCLQESSYASDDILPQDAVWIDMFEPTPEEEQAVENALKLNVPTREELEEIEISSRLYKEKGVLFMTATLIAQADTPRPETTAVTFVLTETRLVTVRYAALRSFPMFISQQRRGQRPIGSGELVMLGLLDAIVDRTADLLEGAGNDLDAVSLEIFSQRGPTDAKRPAGHLQRSLRRIGRNGDITSKISESLVTLARLLAFFGQTRKDPQDPHKIKGLLEVLEYDVKSLTSHAAFLSDKTNFLLSATLGMVNIEQTDIIKIFSVAAVMFLPPTLVASIYGMNFEFMPELHWTLGYPLAVVLMIASAVVPFMFFKRRGWL